ncbi:hypothetical protein GQR58_024923 [Nymphon striatum]|nr:hypothetical protein GQR58_024923 [Nymphon striatum]
MHHYAKFQRPICKDAPVYSEQTHTPFWPPFWIQYGDDTQDPHGSLSYIIMHHYAKFQRPICKDAPVFNKLLNEKKKKIITHNENTPVRPSFRSVEKIDFETDFENSENDYLEVIPYQYETVLQAGNLIFENNHRTMKELKILFKVSPETVYTKERPSCRFQSRIQIHY